MAVVQEYSKSLERELDEVFKTVGKKLAPKLGFHAEQDHPILAEMPVIRAVDRNGAHVSLRRYVNALRTGRYWPKSGLKLRKLNLNEKTNFELWQEVSRLMIIIVNKYISLPKQTQLPLHWVIFRHKSDFVAGSWNAFHNFWLPFVDFMPKNQQAEVLNSLKYGVDITQETQHFPYFATTAYRHQATRMMSVPLFDVEYDHCYGRKRRLSVDDEQQKPYGYRPILFSEFSKNRTFDAGIFMTSNKHLQCQVTIGKQLEEWLKTGAIQFVGARSEWAESSLLKYYANT